MSTLRSGIDELRVEDLDGVDDDGLEGALQDLERMAAALQVEILRRVATVDRRGAFRRDGYLNTASWLARRLGLSWGEAISYLRVARALEDMPRAREALESGQISRSAVRVLVAAREAHPEEFACAEEVLVEAARNLTIRELHRAAAYWRQAVDSARAEEDEEWLHHRRHLHLSPTIAGIVRVDGDLDPETGQTVITALRAVMDAEARKTAPDGRSSGQRRADALGEICRQWLDGSGRPQVAGERPHVTITMGIEAVEGRTGEVCELDDAGPIHPETARRMACDASISRIITRGRSEPLDVGRRTPIVPAPLRRAVLIRDGHCRFPGCDRPHAWCDAHHIVHWADGGRTALSNLVLLCRPHHRLLHGPGGFRVELANGRPVFRRPDGNVLEDRAPP
jgi:hypothetical protein